MAHQSTEIICPSCNHVNPEQSSYCVRCRFHFLKRNLLALKVRDHFYWIIRRSTAGFVSGLIAWFFIPALGRVLAQGGAGNSILYFLSTGLLGGTFLGSVDGMVEESTPKTIRGALLGAFGGILGGLLFSWVNPQLSNDHMYWGFFLMWSIPGALIGLTSALWERKALKLTTGALAGLVGGGVGGALGNLFYYSIIRQYQPSHWAMVRLSEGLCGGLIGVTLWSFIGVAERLVIFKRRFLEGGEHKICDQCDFKNPLNAWYCSRCGSVLQVAAPATKLHLSPFVTLDRLREMFQFLSRLAVITGIIAGLFAFILLLPVDFALALASMLLVAVASYSLMIAFSAVSETLKIFTQK